jgi:hypothetical protein
MGYGMQHRIRYGGGKLARRDDTGARSLRHLRPLLEQRAVLERRPDVPFVAWNYLLLANGAVGPRPATSLRHLRLHPDGPFLRDEPVVHAGRNPGRRLR